MMRLNHMFKAIHTTMSRRKISVELTPAKANTVVTTMKAADMSWMIIKDEEALKPMARNLWWM